jgi:hypothetical protein
MQARSISTRFGLILNCFLDGSDNEIEMRLFAEPFDSSSRSRYLTVKSLSRVAAKRSLRNLDAAKILDHLSMISSRAPADSLLDLRTVEWSCREYKRSYPNFVPIDEPRQKYGVTVCFILPLVNNWLNDIPRLISQTLRARLLAT